MVNRQLNTMTSEYWSTNHQHAVWSAKIQAANQLLTSWNGQVSQNQVDLHLFRFKYGENLREKSLTALAEYRACFECWWWGQ